MNAYLLIPLLGAVLSTALGCVIMTMSFRSAPNRIAGVMLLGAGFWGGCEVLWNIADSAESALWLCRISTPGWVFVAPLVVHLVNNTRELPSRQVASLLPALYGVAGIFLVLAFVSPWMLDSMEVRPWGYGMVPGPAFGAWLVFTAAIVAGGMVAWARTPDADGTIDGANRVALAALLWPLAGVVFLTDALLPFLEIQSPRVGPLAVSGGGAFLCWWMHRYGYSRASPAAFSRRILETLPDGVALATLTGRIRTVNEKMAELLGTTQKGAEGLPLAHHLSASLHDPVEVREVETELVQVSGHEVPVSISTAPMRDNLGRVMGQVLIVRDLREVATLRARLVTSGRMAAVGELAAGIAHEINNPLAFVRANLSSLKRDWESIRKPRATVAPADSLLDGLEDWDELIDDTIEGVDRAAAIIRDVREFSHSGGEIIETADVEQLLDQSLRLARSQIPLPVEIQTEYAGGLPRVECAPQRLMQVFVNLVMNAG